MVSMSEPRYPCGSVTRRWLRIVIDGSGDAEDGGRDDEVVGVFLFAESQYAEMTPRSRGPQDERLRYEEMVVVSPCS